MKKLIFPIIFILFSINVLGFNNIYTFDDKTDIIVTTNVYKEGVPKEDATCNLTIFNPSPNESIINISVLMENKGNGIFIYDLTGMLDYNDEIYPITLSCNDSTGVFGSDERVGIKIGAKVYDYIIAGGILITIAFLFIYMSFKVSDELKSLKLFMFYFGLLFIMASLFYGQAVTDSIPGGEGFKVIFSILIPVYLLMILLFIYLQFTDKLEVAVNFLTGSK